MADRDLVAALVKRAEGRDDRVPVFPIMQPSTDEAIAHAQRLVAAIWPQFGECGPKVEDVTTAVARLRLPDEGRVDVFHASGAIAAVMSPRETRTPIAADERRADRESLVRRAEELAATIAKSHVSANDGLQNESVWELKGRGVALSGEASPAALFEILVAFRRYLHGLPVLGRASVHVALGSRSTVTKWGIDWRRVRPEPIAHTPVVDPQEAASRIAGDLFWRRPEKPFTLDDFEPKSFKLGYLSMSRRREQQVMQPAWVAILAPRGRTSMGHVLAVPASPHAFDPIDRPAKMRPGG